LDVVVISLDHDRKALDQYVQEERLPWAILHEKHDIGEHPLAIQCGITRTPAAFLADESGEVIAIDAGSQKFDRSLEKLLGPPYVPAGMLSTLDLRPEANRRLTDDAPNNLQELIQGERTFGGVRFHIGDSLMQVDRGRPMKIEGIKVNRKFTRLYLLQGTEYGNSVPEGTVIGNYHVNYEDGSHETIPLVLGEDVRDWWNMDRSKPVKRGKVVWEGTNPAAQEGNYTLRLYLGAWENPQPNKKVVSIDFVSTDTRASPFCVALTIEETRGPSGAEDALDSLPK
jgi:hypothetical protein